VLCIPSLQPVASIFNSFSQPTWAKEGSPVEQPSFIDDEYVSVSFSRLPAAKSIDRFLLCFYFVFTSHISNGRCRRKTFQYARFIEQGIASMRHWSRAGGMLLGSSTNLGRHRGIMALAPMCIEIVRFSARPQRSARVYLGRSNDMQPGNHKGT
jgi:hypothetical protein